MNKREMILSFVFVFIFFNANYVFSDQAGCTLSAELVNQDPYPGLPGDEVEVLFQLNGITNACEQGVAVDLVLDYPFSLQGYQSSMRFLESATYSGYGYASYWNNVYKIKIDEEALDGEYELEFRYKEGADMAWQDEFSFERFIIKLEDGRTDFEVHIDNHDIDQRDLVFQILNVGNQDVEALAVEIPDQDNIIVKGSNRNIVGDLDSNEYTNANFEAIPFDGEITIFIHYTDSINERRTIEKKVVYNSAYFTSSLQNMEEDNLRVYVILISLFIFFFVLHIVRKSRKNKRRRSKFSI